MTSIRASRELLRSLHAATPPGHSLAATICQALAMAGGPQVVRETIEGSDRRHKAVARVGRLRMARHRSVMLDPGDQLALAQATGRWCRLLEERGLRRYDPRTRTLTLALPPAEAARARVRLRRDGADLA